MLTRIRNEITALSQWPWKWLVILAVVVISAAGITYKLFWHKAPVTGVFTPAKPADGMADAPTHQTAPAPLQAYDKAKAVKIMGIPAIVLADPKLELIATSKTTKDRQGYSTVSAALVNTETGKGTIIEKKERAIFSFLGSTELGARAGIGTNGQTGSIYARQDLLRIGNVYVAGYGEANLSALKPAEAKAMVDVSWRW